MTFRCLQADKKHSKASTIGEYGQQATSSSSRSSSALASFAFAPTAPAPTTTATTVTTDKAHVDSRLTESGKELTKRRKLDEPVSGSQEKFTVTVPELAIQPESSTSSPRDGSAKKARGGAPAKPASTSSISISGGRRSPRNATADAPAILTSQIETAPGVSSSSSTEVVAETIIPIANTAAETHEEPAVATDNASNTNIPVEVTLYTYAPFIIFISHPNMTSIICSI